MSSKYSSAPLQEPTLSVESSKYSSAPLQEPTFSLDNSHFSVEERGDFYQTRWFKRLLISIIVHFNHCCAVLYF